MLRYSSTEKEEENKKSYVFLGEGSLTFCLYLTALQSLCFSDSSNMCEAESEMWSFQGSVNAGTEVYPRTFKGRQRRNQFSRIPDERGAI